MLAASKRLAEKARLEQNESSEALQSRGCRNAHGNDLKNFYSSIFEQKNAHTEKRTTRKRLLV